MLYFKSVLADFQTRDEAHRLRVRNVECGIDHVTHKADRSEAPTVRPLVEVKCLAGPRDLPPQARKRARRLAW